MIVYRVATIKGTLVNMWEKDKKFFMSLISRTAQTDKHNVGQIPLNTVYEILEPALWPPRSRETILISSAHKHEASHPNTFPTGWWHDTIAKVTKVEA